MSLLILPTEVLHLIARNLGTSHDTLALVLTCARSCEIFQYSLYEFNALYQGSSALIWAAGHGQKDLTKRLLRHPRILANPTDAAGRTPLFRAIAARDIDMVRLLVSDSRVAIGWRDHRQISPLSVAAAHGMQSAIRILVGLGADINSCDGEGNTPLHYAAQHRQESSVRQLFQYHNLYSSAMNKNGATAYHVAMLTFHDSITRLFIDQLGSSGNESSRSSYFARLEKYFRKLYYVFLVAIFAAMLLRAISFRLLRDFMTIIIAYMFSQTLIAPIRSRHFTFRIHVS